MRRTWTIIGVGHMHPQGTRSRRSARRGAAPEPEYWHYGISLRDPDGYYVTISALSAA
jgi:hypothetical protein